MGQGLNCSEGESRVMEEPVLRSQGALLWECVKDLAEM